MSHEKILGSVTITSLRVTRFQQHSWHCFRQGNPVVFENTCE